MGSGYVGDGCRRVWMNGGRGVDVKCESRQ